MTVYDTLFSKGSANGANVTAAALTIFVLCLFSTQFMRTKALTVPSFCKGKNILLTGATGGLGRALAMKLSDYGAKCLVLSGRDDSALISVAGECRDAGAANVHIINCDLSDLDAVEKLASTTMEICDIDIFIHCGGVSSRSSFLDTNISVDKTLMTINFFSGALLAKKLVPSMVGRRSGRVIWISSVQGLCKLHHHTLIFLVLSVMLILYISGSWDSLQNELCFLEICRPRLLRSS